MDFDNLSPGLPRAKQIRILVIASLVVVGVVLAIKLAHLLFDPVPPKPVALPPGELQLSDSQFSTLKVAPVLGSDGMQHFGASGTITVDETRSTPIFMPYAGQILQVYVEAGAQVAQGDPLLRIRTSDIVDARNALFTAQAQHDGAAAQLRVAQENAARAEQLYRSAGGALKDYQQAQADLANARAAMRTSESAMGAARDKLVVYGKTPGEIRSLEGASGISGLHAETNLRAPIGGVVATRAVSPGQFVTVGGDKPALVIADLSRVWLVAQLSETDAARVHVGDRVVVTTNAYPGRTFAATIDNIAAQLDPLTHSLAVRASIPNPDRALKPQMFASFAITDAATGTPRATTVAVPAEAVIHEGDEARVWIVLGHNRVVARTVQTGETNNGMVTILSGLRPGERIVTQGALFVNEAGLSD